MFGVSDSFNHKMSYEFGSAGLVGAQLARFFVLGLASVLYSAESSALKKQPVQTFRGRNYTRAVGWASVFSTHRLF